jgi:hypothetical protein
MMNRILIAGLLLGLAFLAGCNKVEPVGYAKGMPIHEDVKCQKPMMQNQLDSELTYQSDLRSAPPDPKDPNNKDAETWKNTTESGMIPTDPASPWNKPGAH